MCRFVFCRLLPVVVVLLAVIVGLIMSTEVPMGTFFWLLFQPMRVSDMLQGKLTPPVPDDLRPAPRPPNEIFFTMPSGAKMPGSGIGMCCRSTAYDQPSVRATTLWYLLKGGRLIDTADLYLNHRAIGEAIKDAELRGIPRSEIFVTTKIWPTSFGSSQVVTAWVDRVLGELGLDYVDLVLLHAPSAPKGLVTGDLDGAFAGYPGCSTMVDCWRTTWQGLAAARRDHKVRDIGVSNFNSEHLAQLLSLDIVVDHPVAVNQVPFNPWVPEWQKQVVQWCHDHNIAVTGYSTLGGTFGKDNAATAATLQEISKKHHTSPFLVLARWSLQKGVAVIPGTGNPKHMDSNLAVYKFELSDDEVARIGSFSPEDAEAPIFFAMAPPKANK